MDIVGVLDRELTVRYLNWTAPSITRDAVVGRSVFYFVTDLEAFRDRDVLIIGGGDSAVDWALGLQGIARSLTLCHRRDRFRAQVTLRCLCARRSLPR